MFLTTLIIYLVINKIDTVRLFIVLKQANLVYLLLATLLFVLSKVVSAYRLNIFFHFSGVNIPQLFNIKLYWLGMYYNLFLPGGIGGDGYKIFLLNKITKIKIKNLLFPVLLDRVTGLLALFCLALHFGYFIPYFNNFWYFLWLAIPFVILIFYLINYFFFKQYLPSFKITTIQSFIVQIAQVFCAYLILKALDINMYFGMYLFVFLISSIIAIIPFTIGGIGARELTFILASGYLELDTETAIGLSILFFVINTIVSLSGMYYSFNLNKETITKKYSLLLPEGI